MLRDFLLKAFSQSELRRLIRYLPQGGEYVHALPGRGSSHAELVDAVVYLVVRMSIASDVFDALRQERPRRAAEVDAIENAWPDPAAGPSSTSPADGPAGTPGQTPADDGADAGLGPSQPHLIIKSEDPATPDPGSASLESAFTPIPREPERAWRDDEDPALLEQALAQGDAIGTEAVLGRLRTHLDTYVTVRLGADAARRVLQSLRRHALLDELVELGQRLLSAGETDHEVRLELAKGLIEAGLCTEAIDLTRAVRDQLDHEVQALQAQGGFANKRRATRLASVECGQTWMVEGRAYQALYLQARPSAHEARQADLHAAQAAFQSASQADDALLAEAEMEQLLLQSHHQRVVEASPADQTALRQRVDETLRAFSQSDEPVPTESLVTVQALAKRYPDAVQVLRDHLQQAEHVDGYDLTRLLRRLGDLLGLRTDQPPGSLLLPLIHARLATLSGGSALPQPPEGFEAVWKDTDYQPLGWLLRALTLSRAVARIGRTQLKGVGSGFRVDGASLHASLAGKPLVLTAAHVVSPDPKVVAMYQPYVGTLAPDQARVDFFADDGSVRCGARVARVLATSPPKDLDFSLIELEPVELADIPTPAWSATVPAARRRVNAIGHPHGGEKSVSLQGNRVIELDGQGRWLYYMTPTDPGSSGCPVFDNETWEVVALHHAGPKAAQANRGVLMGPIRQAIAQQLAG